MNKYCTYRTVRDEELAALSTSTTNVIELLFNLSKGVHTLVISQDKYIELITHQRFYQYFLQTAEVSKSSKEFSWQGITVKAEA